MLVPRRLNLFGHFYSRECKEFLDFFGSGALLVSQVGDTYCNLCRIKHASDSTGYTMIDTINNMIQSMFNVL